MSKKKTTTTSSQQVTPTNPEWVTSGLQGMGSNISNLAAQDPTKFVAGPSSLQTQAFKDATNLSTSPAFGQASDMINNVAKAAPATYTAQGYTAKGYDPTSYQASSLLDGLDKYMSPYTNDVVNTALADYDYGAGQSRAQQALDEANSQAFGGSGAVLGRTMLEDTLSRGRGTLSAGLRDTAFTRGSSLSATDAAARNEAARANAEAANQAAAAQAAAQNQAAQFAAAANNQAAQFGATSQNSALDRQLSAGNSLASLGTQMGNDQRANLVALDTLGQDQRSIAQAQAASPLTVLQALSGAYGQLPLSLLHGGTTTGTGTETVKDPLGQFTALLSALGSPPSGAAAAGG